MKTSFKNLIVATLTIVALTSSIFVVAASAGERKPTSEVTAPTNFRRVSVKGNVEITLIQRQTEGVSYADDNAGKAKITQEGNLLKIASADKDLVKLVVYVNDLFRIEASENAIVKTSGKINSKFLQVFLKGSASADINSNTEGLYTVIEENADLKLSGATDNHTLVMSSTPKLTFNRFAALQTNVNSSAAIITETAALIK